MPKNIDLIRNTDRQKRPNLSTLVAAMIKMHKIIFLPLELNGMVCL